MWRVRLLGPCVAPVIDVASEEKQKLPLPRCSVAHDKERGAGLSTSFLAGSRPETRMNARETLIKYRTVRCVRGGWMQADRRSAGWNLRKESRAADAAPDATRQRESAFEGPALLARTPERRRRGPACGDPTAQACVKPAGGVRIPLRGRIHRAGRDGSLLRPPRARGAGSSLYRPATRPPRRLALGQNRSVAQRET